MVQFLILAFVDLLKYVFMEWMAPENESLAEAQLGKFVGLSREELVYVFIKFTVLCFDF